MWVYGGGGQQGYREGGIQNLGAHWLGGGGCI